MFGDYCITKMISIYAILLSNDVQNQLAVFVLRYFGDVEEPKRRPILDNRENSNNSKNTVFQHVGERLFKAVYKSFSALL